MPAAAVTAEHAHERNNNNNNNNSSSVLRAMPSLVALSLRLPSPLRSTHPLWRNGPAVHAPL
jgi:hypothetical protein